MVRALFIAIEVAGLFLITAGVYILSAPLSLIVFGAGVLVGSYLYNR